MTDRYADVPPLYSSGAPPEDEPLRGLLAKVMREHFADGYFLRRYKIAERMAREVADDPHPEMRQFAYLTGLLAGVGELTAGIAETKRIERFDRYEDGS